ncbi:MAG: glycosyltransferase family 2 protein [Flavobacteriales bacterium]
MPVFNEEECLPLVIEDFFKYLSESLPDYRFEITFIDDCSSDNSFKVISSYVAKAPSNVKLNVVRLAKNSGSHTAITAALNICRGDFSIIMASDGQDPVYLVKELLDRWIEGKDLVLAIRERNSDQSFLSRSTSKLAWQLLSWATKLEIDRGGCDVMGLDRKVVNAFNRMDERNTTFVFRILSLGFDRTTFYYEKRARLVGQSKWNFVKRIGIFVDAVAGFSNRPIRLIVNFGLTIFVVLVLRWLYVIYNAYVLGHEPSQFSIILNTIFTVAAIQILLIGIIGDYTWRILDEARKRPSYDFSDSYGEVFNDDEPS